MKFTPSATPEIGDRSTSKTTIYCPLCGKDKAGYARRDRGREWHVFTCYSCKADGLDNVEWLRDAAAEVGAPGAGHLLSDAPRWLGHLAVAAPSSGGAEPLPTPAHIEGYRERLRASAAPLRHLRQERGLTDSVIKQARLGFDGEFIVMPMYDPAGELVACKWLEPRVGGRKRNIGGRDRAWPLYPQPRGPAVVLTAGEPDALCALSHGIRATSVTLGAGTWKDEWSEQLRNKHVLVAFDLSEHPQALRAARKLRLAKISARCVDLRKLGLTEKGADISDYLNGGGSVRSLKVRMRHDK